MMAESMLANGVLAVLADASLKVTVVLVAAGLWALLDGSASAAMRHLVWLVALGSALVLPAIVPFAPAWRVPLPLPDRPSLNVPVLFEAREAGELVTDVVPEPVVWSAGEDAITAVRAAAGPVAPAIEAPPGVAWVSPKRAVQGIAGDDIQAAFAADGGGTAAGLLLVWLAGLIAVATPRVRARLRLRQVEEVALPIGSLRVRGEACRVVAEMGLRRRVRLLEGPSGSMPMTWGVVRPVVLLPADAWTWSAERLRAVLRHELAHVKRLDALTHGAAELACVLHWFNPFVWYGAKRLREESEHACDDRVIAHGGEPADYAAELVDLARSLRPAGAGALAGMSMTRGRSLRGRLIAVLDDGRDRRPVSALDALRAVAVASILMLPLACLAPAAAPGPGPWVMEAPEAVAWEASREPSLPEPAAMPPEEAMPADEALRPEEEMQPEPGTIRPEPAVLPVAEARRDQGRRPDPDLTVRVLRQAAAGLGDRELADLLELAAAAGGISNDATRSAFLDAARAIGSDSDRARALGAWLETGPDEPGLIGLVDVAGGIGSDREAAAVLAKAAGVRTVSPALREAILRALEGVGSERERQRVMAAVR